MGMAILIVDDTRSIRALMEFHLQNAGLGPVLHAATADECYACLGMDGHRCPNGDIHLVLMDLQLPDATGIDALARIRATERLTTIPVLLATADLTPTDREAALAAGADGFIAKPLEHNDFIDAVRQALAHRSSPRPHPLRR